MHQLRYYQEEGITAISRLLASGTKRVIRQLMTGGGKTVEFATICNRYYQKSGNKILVLVHRVELLQQAYRTLYDWYKIPAQVIDADTKRLFDRPVYIGMVETVFRRLSRNPNYIPNIGLIIIDESHRGEFKKMHAFYPDNFLLGYTATPISSTKKDPLKNYFAEIVTGPAPTALIEMGSLVQNRTYSIKGINRKNFHVKGNDFDLAEMGAEFSKSKHVKNTLEAYLKHGKGKAIIYNCNIEHSHLVRDAFAEAGFQVKHVDGTTPDHERKAIFKWLADTPDAILCNVDIATTGTDIPSVETIIMNRSTKSLVIWLQCTGRGARPFPGKDFFTIIDLGGNAIEHGDWSDERDWSDIFHNPAKPREKKGAAPVKDCPQCEYILPVQSMRCPECGFEFPKKVEYDGKMPELELFTKNIDVQAMVEKNADKKPYYTLFQIGNNIATQAKYKIRNLTDASAEKLLELYNEKAKEWCYANNKKFNQWHKDVVRDHLYKQLGLSSQPVPAEI